MKMLEERQRQQITLRIVGILALFTILFSMLSFDVFAQSTDDTTQSTEGLAQGEVLNRPGFFGADVVQIDGTVEGTTFAAGQVVHVNGTINGSLFVAAQTVYINGEVTGNIYGAGQTITVDAQSDSDAFLAGATVNVNPDTEIGRDLFITAASVMQEGTVSRHLFGAGDNFTLNGPVGGDAELDVEELTLNDSAEIAGNLTYQSPQEAVINPSATVDGETNWERRVREMPEERREPTQSERIISELLSMLWSILSALLLWLFFRLWRPNFWMNTIQPVAAAPLKTVGIGLLALIGLPFLILLLLFTVIGIPLATILGLLYLIALILSKTIVAVFIGSWLAGQFNWNNLRNKIWLVLLGLIILELISLIPYVNFFIAILVTITGFGALILSPINRKKVERV